MAEPFQEGTARVSNAGDTRSVLVMFTEFLTNGMLPKMPTIGRGIW